MKRVLLITVFVLFLISFFSGLANFFFIKKLDVSYSDALDSNLHTGAIMRSVARESTLRQRELTNLLLFDNSTTASSNKAVYYTAIQQSAKRNADNLAKLGILLTNPAARVKFDEMMKVRELCNVEFDKVLNLFKEGKISEAIQYKNTNLRPLFSTYLTKQDAMAEQLETADSEKNVNLTQWSSFLGWISVGLSTWPVILISIIIIAFLIGAFLIGWNMPDEHT